MTNTDTPDPTDLGLTREGTPRQRRRFAVPSTWIADRTKEACGDRGYSRQGIFRIRDVGNRDALGINPERMRVMEETFDWSQDDQYQAIKTGRWAEEFEKVVAAAYEEEAENDRV